MMALYCYICKKSFSGAEPANQHYASQSHRKKEQVANQMRDDSFAGRPVGAARPQCSVCNVFCDTHEMLQKHRLSPKHRTNAEKLMAPDVISCSEGRGRSNSVLSGSSSDSSTSGLETDEPKGEEYVFNGTRGYCYVCQIDLTSASHANQHLKGMKHNRGKVRKTLNKKISGGSSGIHTDHSRPTEEKAGRRGGAVGRPCNGTYFGSPQLTCSISQVTYLREQQCSDTALNCDGGERESRPNEPGPHMQSGRVNLQAPDVLPVSRCADFARFNPEPYPTNSPRRGSISPVSSEGYLTCDDEDVLLQDPPSFKPDNSLHVGIFTDDTISSFVQWQDDRPGKVESCKTLGCHYHCPVCDVHCNGPGPKDQHLSSKKHLNRQEKMRKPALQMEPTDDNPFPGFYSYCKLCMVPFNTENSEMAHHQGRHHRERVAKSQIAEARELPKIVKIQSQQEKEITSSRLVKTVPRDYQRELFGKAMQTDVVCFLPTGTGKTLVSAMVISHMLQINPHRNVVFLVDRVLLVLQQSNVLRQEIGDKRFSRYNTDTSQMEERTLRIAAVCSNQQDTSELPLCKQDVLVVTAAYYENLLDQQLVRWEDLCLVVLDEAHHCMKGHPFHRLLREHSSDTAPDERPKVLGLTASPAGKATVPQTEAMLRELLDNLGGAEIAMVDKNQEELDHYQSQARLLPRLVTHSDEEKQFKQALLEHLASCYHLMAVDSTLENFDIGIKGNVPLGHNIKMSADYLNRDVIQGLLDVMNKIEARKHENRVTIESLKWHTKVMCNAAISLAEVGLMCALEELVPLMDKSHPGCFNNARELGVSCERLHKATKRFVLERPQITETYGEEGDLMPFVENLVSLMKEQIDWNVPKQGERPMALILVRRRANARRLAKILEDTPSFQELDLKPVWLVGHGAKGGDEGMTLKQQERILREITENKHQIIIATSVAEEGLDLPECQLVVQLDPPNSVTALVQIRGRARKKNSKFIALCRDQEKVDAIQRLLQKEDNMKIAARNILEKTTLRRQNRDRLFCVRDVVLSNETLSKSTSRFLSRTPNITELFGEETHALTC